MSLGESGSERKTKRTRKREFLDEMNLVVPWAELVSLITPHAPAAGVKGGRPPFAVETMLRIHFIQWFNLSDPTMEEALYNPPSQAVQPGFQPVDFVGDFLGSLVSLKRHHTEARNVRTAGFFFAPAVPVTCKVNTTCPEPSSITPPRGYAHRSTEPGRRDGSRS